MSKIYFGDELIWNRDHLPRQDSEHGVTEAQRLMQQYSVVDITDLMAEALSCGIDVMTSEGTFRVVLSTDEKRWITRKVR